MKKINITGLFCNCLPPTAVLLNVQAAASSKGAVEKRDF